MNRIIRSLALVALAWLLGGCGFELRGAAQLAPDLSPVFIQAPAGSRIAHALRKSLSLNGAAVTGDPTAARSSVRILGEYLEDRVSAVNNQGKAIATELSYKVHFDALDAAGGTRMAGQVITLAREYVNPEIEVIGKTEEAELIRRDMVADMADRILHRLRAGLR